MGGSGVWDESWNFIHEHTEHTEHTWIHGYSNALNEHSYMNIHEHTWIHLDSSVVFYQTPILSVRALHRYALGS